MDLKKTLLLMEAAAVQTGQLLLGMQPQTRRLESRKDFLTDADLQAEEMILKMLSTEYPTIPSLSEEKGGVVQNGYLWIIDPLDGTINFFLGDDHWGVSIALAKEYQTIAGVVYLPAKDQLFSACSNSPTMLRSVNEQLGMKTRLSEDQELSSSHIWVEWGKETQGGKDHEKVCGLIARLDRQVLYPQIRNCATATMMSVASGKITGCVCAKPDPFDIAAAGLIVEQSGGMVTDLEGVPWSPFSHSIVASNGVIHQELLETLKGGTK